MNRHDWLTSDNPRAMLDCFHRASMSPSVAQFLSLSDRKLRLFACACVRRPEVWGTLNNRDQRAVEIVERRTGAGWERLYGEQSRAFWEGLSDAVYSLGWNSAAEAAVKTIGACQGEHGLPASTVAVLLREVAGDPFWPMVTEKDYLICVVASASVNARAHAIQERSDRRGTEGHEVYREAVRSMVLPQACLSPTALALAETTWTDRDFARLPILADALEDAGCPTAHMCWNCQGTGSDGLLMTYDARKYIIGDPDYELETKPAPCEDCNGTGKVPSRLLAHLRGPGPHALGCWALDLALGKG